MHVEEKYECLRVFSPLLSKAEVLVLVRSGNMGYDKLLILYEDMGYVFVAICFDLISFMN
jgi:hypothetical protein